MNTKFTNIEMLEIMQEALSCAIDSFHNDEVPIGAVITDSTGKIIAKSDNFQHRTKNPLKHAEMCCIDEALKITKDQRLVGCSLYVTVEPCLMCVGAIINSRIDTVIFGVRNKKFGSIVSVLNINNYKYNHSFNFYEFKKYNETIESMLKTFFQSKRK